MPNRFYPDSTRNIVNVKPSAFKRAHKLAEDSEMPLIKIVTDAIHAYELPHGKNS